MHINLKSPSNDIVEWFQLSFPELVQKMKNSNHHYDEKTLNPYHIESDVFTHTMMVCLQAKNIAPENDYVRWSSLLHDIGKPDARKVNDENRKVSFHGHEGLSTYMAIDILNQVDMSVSDKILVTKIIATHGDLFHFVKSDGTIKNDIFDHFRYEGELLKHLVYQVSADSHGRFWSSAKVENFKKDLPMQFESVISQIDKNVLPLKKDKKPKCFIMIGPPCSGKTTYINKNYPNATIISRDNLVETVGRKRGLNYSEAFKFINDNKEVATLEVDGALSTLVNESKNSIKDIVCDLTNMSRKSRRKWIHEFKNHDKIAVVFMTGLQELKKRNKIRGKNTGKFIPEHVLIDMCLRYCKPNFSEGFDEIIYEFTETNQEP